MNRTTIVLLLLSMTALFAQWEPDVRLTATDSASHTTYNNARSITTGPGGVVHVAWYDCRDGAQGEIYYKRSTDRGTTWSDDVRLTEASGVSDNPSVAVTGDRVHVLWRDTRDDVRGELYYKRSTDAGVSWSEDVRLTEDPAYCRYPSLAVADTVLHAVWVDERAGNPEIWYKRSDDAGLTWSDDLRLTDAPMESYTPSVAVSGANIQVAWRDWRDRSFEIYHKRSTDNGMTWSMDERMSTASTGSYNPCIAASGTDVHLLWHDHRHMSAPELYYRRSTDNGATWSGEMRMTEDSSGSYNVSVWAVGSRVHVAWEDLYGVAEICYLQSTDRGVSWSEKLQLTHSGNHSAAANITAGDSAVHIVWTDFRDHVNGEVYYKRNLTASVGLSEANAGTRVGAERAAARVVRGAFFLGGGSRARLLDAAGRGVMELVPGDNDLGRLGPGVYFVRGAEECEAVKIVLQR